MTSEVIDAVTPAGDHGGGDIANRSPGKVTMYQHTMSGLVATHHALPRPAARPATETALAFAYLTLFRRLVVGTAVLGAAFAWTAELPALAAALACISVGEFLESSYYLNVLRWRQRNTFKTTR